MFLAAKIPEIPFSAEKRGTGSGVKRRGVFLLEDDREPDSICSIFCFISETVRIKDGSDNI